MSILVWLIAYIVGFGLLQLLLYRYFQREDPSPGTTPSPVEGSSAVAVGSTNGEPTGIHCRECGTHNESNSMYVYCQSCASRLR